MDFDELIERILTAQEQMLKHNIEANSVTLNGRKYGQLIENVPPNMKPTVFGMAVKADYAMPDDYDFLVQYDPMDVIEEYPAGDVRPVVLCGRCELHGRCHTEDVFAFAGLEEENRFCAVGKVKTNGEERRGNKDG